MLNRGHTEQLRVVWVNRNGIRHLVIRAFTRRLGGAWTPDARRGVTLSLRELAPIGAAVTELLARFQLPTESQGVQSAPVTRAPDDGP